MVLTEWSLFLKITLGCEHGCLACQMSVLIWYNGLFVEGRKCIKYVLDVVLLGSPGSSTCCNSFLLYMVKLRNVLLFSVHISILLMQ